MSPERSDEDDPSDARRDASSRKFNKRGYLGGCSQASTEPEPCGATQQPQDAHRLAVTGQSAVAFPWDSVLGTCVKAPHRLTTSNIANLQLQKAAEREIHLLIVDGLLLCRGNGRETTSEAPDAPEFAC